MCCLIIECFSTQIMHIISLKKHSRILRCQMGLFSCQLHFHCYDFFVLPEFWGKPFCSHRQPQFGHFSGYRSQKCVYRNTWTPFYNQGISKKQESLAILATSICLSLIFAVAFSFISCFSLPLYHEDIFEKKNVHECLQCPPHWNTWGKVSSLTLWSIPTPQLEPQSLIPLRRRSFFSWWGAIFLLEGLFVELEL